MCQETFASSRFRFNKLPIWRSKLPSSRDRQPGLRALCAFNTASNDCVQIPPLEDRDTPGKTETKLDNQVDHPEASWTSLDCRKKKTCIFLRANQNEKMLARMMGNIWLKECLQIKHDNVHTKTVCRVSSSGFCSFCWFPSFSPFSSLSGILSTAIERTNRFSSLWRSQPSTPHDLNKKLSIDLSWQGLHSFGGVE